MKISITGLDIPEGKTKFNDECLNGLVNKDKPKKVSPYFVEFIKDEYINSDIIVVHENSLLDIIILDIEKIENRINRIDDNNEIKILNKCLNLLNDEMLLFNHKFNEESHNILKTLSPITYKPILITNNNLEINELIKKSLQKASYMFFYTSGKTESHAWIVKQNTDILTCASKIHTDLSRGFIKGDVVSYEDYMLYHSFNECKSKGVSKIVDKTYIVQPNEIIEIRFNV